MLSEQDGEQMVIVEFQYSRTDLAPLFELEERLVRALEISCVGVYDRNTMGVHGSRGCLTLYGPDAEKIFAVIQPFLADAPFLRNPQAIVRYGSSNDADVEQRLVPISVIHASV